MNMVLVCASFFTFYSNSDLPCMKICLLKFLMTKLQDGIILTWIALDILKRKTKVLKS